MGSCGSLWGGSWVEMVQEPDLGGEGTGGFSPLAAPSTLGLYSYSHPERVLGCVTVIWGADSYFATDWLGEFGQTI